MRACSRSSSDAWSDAWTAFWVAAFCVAASVAACDALRVAAWVAAWLARAAAASAARCSLSNRCFCTISRSANSRSRRSIASFCGRGWLGDWMCKVRWAVTQWLLKQKASRILEPNLSLFLEGDIEHLLGNDCCH